MFHFISNGELFVVYVTSTTSRIVHVTPTSAAGGSPEPASDSPFLAQDHHDGSGMSFGEIAGSQHVYTVHRHRAYVAIGRDVIVQLLNPDAPHYHRIPTGRNPLQLAVGEYGRETYLYVLYEENDRGYIATYRRYGVRRWGKQGQIDLLVYNPQWFDLSRMSNVIFFEGLRRYHPYRVMYVAYAVGYRVYFKDILDASHFSIQIPKPCENITSINFNERIQALFVVCQNTTFYFSYSQYEIYRSSIWSRAGHTYFSQDGSFAAIATNHSGDMTTLTVHSLKFTPVGSGNKVYMFQHFHHVASRAQILNGVFVTPSKHQHYFCYVEQGEFGIFCVDVEQALSNVEKDGIINDAMILLPNTRSVSCASYNDCPIMYSHGDLMVVQVLACEEACQSKIMFFNMNRLENTLNLTNVSLDMLAYKAHPSPIPLFNLSNTTVNQYEGVSTLRPTTTVALPAAPHVAVATSTATLQTHPALNHNLEIPRPSSTNSVPPSTNGPPLTTPRPPETESDTEDHVALLDSCQNDLVSISNQYNWLFPTTLVLGVCLWVALLVCAVLVVVIICMKRRATLHLHSYSLTHCK